MQSNVLLLLVSSLFMVSVGGCKNPELPPQNNQAGLRADSTLSEKVADLQIKVNLLETRISLRESGAIAILSSSDKGYDLAMTRFGTFPVALKNIVPYLDGYRISLSIGNPTTARFDGFTLRLGAGSRGETYELTDFLVPGRYTNVEVILPHAQSSDIEILSVGLDLNKMSLN
jgi:hypothetical protein